LKTDNRILFDKMTVFSKMAVAGAVLAGSANAKVFFSEDFSKGWESRWTKSVWKGEESMQKMKTSVGKYIGASEEEDAGLYSEDDSKFLGASASFPSFSNEDLDALHIMYTAKYEKDLECGGGYVKVGPKMDDATQFGDPTKYNIMFGPDKCGYNSRTHLIFTNKSGKNVLKKEDLSYFQDTIGVTTLYHLALLKNNTAIVKVNGEMVGQPMELEKDWELTEPKEIADEDDKKPEDWVEEEMMNDPEDKKPEDWVEVKEIPDPDAKQPDDWDVEEDGEWEAPLKANPDYKGDWEAKKVKNPDFKGEWVQKMKPNPEYNEEGAKSLYAFKDFGFIGFDLWQVKAGSIFDNIMITDDEKVVKEQEDKFKARKEKEEEQKKVDDDKAAEEAAAGAAVKKAAKKAWAVKAKKTWTTKKAVRVKKTPPRTSRMTKTCK